MIFEKVREIICEQFEVDEDEITLDTVITEDLDADSLDLVDLVMSFEDEFKVEVPDDAMDKIRTVGDIVKFVEEN